MRLSPPVLAGSHPLATPWGGAHLRRSEYEDVVLGQVMTAVIDLLGAIPPVRYVMGLVDPRWRPLWAALWLVVIPSILFLTVRRLTRRRVPLPPPQQPVRRNAAPAKSVEHEPAGPELEEESRVPKPASTPPRSPVEMPPSAPPPERGVRVPVPVIVAAVVVGVAAVVITSLFLPGKPAAPAPAPVDSSAAADTGLDVRWRSGRMDGVDCLGTFEVKRGSSASAQFVAFVMDTSGAILARDTASVKSAVVPGLLVDFRFRRVACDRIYDWQLQVTTPKARPK